MKKSIKQMQSSLLGLQSVRFLSNQKLLILLAALMVAVSAHAYDFEVDGIYYNLSYTNVEVTSEGSGSVKYSGSIIIPSTVSFGGTSYSVTSIGANAFYGCSDLTSVTIPNSVTTISLNAFYECSSLTSVTIPNSVKYIGNNAFYACSSMTSVAFNAINCEEMGNSSNQVFKGCSALTKVTIGDKVESIPSYAFYNCTDLTSVTIANTVTSIGQNAFNNTALYNDESNWDDGVLYIDNHLIKAKSELITGAYIIKNGTLTLADYAFCDCSDLMSVTIPNSVTSIGDQAFCGCSNLTSVDIPSSVTSIGVYAFMDCTNLIAVAIPNSAISISNTAFFRTALINDKSNWDNGVFYIGNHLIFAAYNQVTGNCTIKNGTSTLANGAFAQCSNLLSVTIPNSVMYIGDSAFNGCSCLASVNIPSSVKYIGSKTFYGCSSLASVDIPDSVTSIGDYAFGDCIGLTYMDIPNSVTSIGMCAFVRCSGLVSVNIPRSVTSIGEHAFFNCTSLTSVTINNHTPFNIFLGDNVYNNCNLNSATLYVPNGSKELYAAADQWSEFGTIEEFQQAINLIDGQPYSETSDIQDVDVNYTRNFKNTNWQPLYLPFAMNYDEWAPYADVAELYNVRGYDRDNDGTVDDVTIEFNRLKEGASIQPNIPYVIKAKETGEVTFECKDKLVTAAPTTEGEVECSSTKFSYAFHGIYEEKTDLFSTGAYFLSKGEFCQAANENVKLSPYRAYLTVAPKTGGYNGDTTPAKAPQRITLVVDDEMETNGIEGIINTAPHDDIYYDLMGRKVANPTSGIYIQNGRKVYIK